MKVKLIIKENNFDKIIIYYLKIYILYLTTYGKS